MLTAVVRLITPLRAFDLHPISVLTCCQVTHEHVQRLRLREQRSIGIADVVYPVPHQPQTTVLLAAHRFQSGSDAARERLDRCQRIPVIHGRSLCRIDGCGVESIIEFRSSQTKRGVTCTAWGTEGNICFLTCLCQILSTARP
jgi:hypothetical protein